MATNVKIGDRFGRLTVLERVENEERWSESEKRIKKRSRWLCQCDCGNKVVLTLGKVQSCGCLLKEARHGNKSHGMTGTRPYNIYHKMKERCYNPNSISYKLYGGRGVKMCDEWLDSFENFYAWAMKNGYADTLSIDRIDPDGDYAPDNCRWSSELEQARNKRNSLSLVVGGEKKSLKEWAAETGIDYYRLRNWFIRNGERITAERVFEALTGKDFGTPLCNKAIEFKGQRYASQRQLAREFGIDCRLLHYRLNKGWSIEEAVGLKEHETTARKKVKATT